MSSSRREGTPALGPRGKPFFNEAAYLIQTHAARYIQLGDLNLAGFSPSASPNAR
ncbi:MAG: hypothetical protein M1541_04150 [Acidobacteria bacterium]|nr:hypothetical protein [Acidobacteriota bacterium]